MAINLTDPVFTDENKARAHLEAIRWPHGPVCPHCGNAEAKRIYGIAANPAKKIRAGLRECGECGEQFTVQTGSVMESSHVPLNKWVLAYRLMASAKKGISAHQMHRTIGVTYKTAWFMCHRIRESMREINPTPLGGKGKIVEADETYVGGKPRRGGRKSKFGRGTKKIPVVALIERGGRARAVSTPDAKAETLTKLIRANVDKRSKFMTDEWRPYIVVGRDFKGGHHRVEHGAGVYAKGEAHVNSAEGFFGLFKRGIVGSFHHVSAQHIDRYCDEFAFRWSLREIDDTERAIAAIKGAEGKRLTYRPARSA
jgi:transposase-like protein